MALLNIKTNQELLNEERAREAEASPPEVQTYQIIGYLRRKWDQALRAKRAVEAQMIENIRQASNQYSPAKLSQIRQVGGSEVFVPITNVKCNNAIHWIRDILFTKPWGVKPTPDPELPLSLIERLKTQYVHEVMNQIAQLPESKDLDMKRVFQYIRDRLPFVEDEINKLIRIEAQEKAKEMERTIDDKLTEAKWYEALNECIWDIVVVKNGFIKGPIQRYRNVNVIETDELGEEKPVVKREIVKEYERVSPFDIYPEPDSRGINDGYLFEHVSYRRHDLYDLIGVEGFDEEAIRTVLSKYTEGGYRDWTGIEAQRAELEGREPLAVYESDKIDALIYWGPVPGRMLLEWGLSETEITDPDMDYNISAILIDQWLIKVTINENPFGQKPYYTASYDELPDSFWGKALPERIEGVHTICNACARAIVNNVGMGSGPQVEINIDRIVGGEKADMRLQPWKRWLTTNRMMQSGSAINFWQPSMHAHEILTVFQAFSKIADEHSGVPAYAHGDPQVGGAGNALADYERILTPDGPVAISSIRVGDQVCNTYGSFSTVTGVYPQGETDIFRVKFSNGEYVDCDINHRWSVRTHHDRKFQTLTTKQILDKGLFRRTKIDQRSPKGYRPKWMIPIIDCVEFKERAVKIDPYTMGVLLGDGDARCRITTADKEIFDRIPYPLGKEDVTIRGTAKTRAVKGIRSAYHSYGLNCKTLNKFIPEDYLYNSREVRLELLRGLMDTDGCCSKMGEVFFTTSSYKLAKDFVKLVRSLGGIVKSISQEEGGTFKIRNTQCVRQKTYRIVFNLPREKIFHLYRKQSRVKQHPKTHVYITGIEYLGRFSATCISVDAENQLFICENFIPTHNTASGLSMLITQAARAIKGVVRNIDNHITKPSIESIYNEVLHDPKYRNRIGDVKLVAMGSTALVEKEQKAIRMLEFLNITNNPVDNQITGIGGRAYLLSEIAQTSEIDPDKFLAGIRSIPPELLEASPEVAANVSSPGSPGSFGNTGSVVSKRDLTGAKPSGTEYRLIEGRGGHPAKG